MYVFSKVVCKYTINVFTLIITHTVLPHVFKLILLLHCLRYRLIKWTHQSKIIKQRCLILRGGSGEGDFWFGWLSTRIIFLSRELTAYNSRHPWQEAFWPHIAPQPI
jgi:hypothetical protein